jgi:hypothetical protein
MLRNLWALKKGKNLPQRRVGCLGRMYPLWQSARRWPVEMSKEKPRQHTEPYLLSLSLVIGYSFQCIPINKTGPRLWVMSIKGHKQKNRRKEARTEPNAGLSSLWGLPIAEGIGPEMVSRGLSSPSLLVDLDAESPNRFRKYALVP